MTDPVRGSALAEAAGQTAEQQAAAAAATRQRWKAKRRSIRRFVGCLRQQFPLPPWPPVQPSRPGALYFLFHKSSVTCDLPARQRMIWEPGRWEAFWEFCCRRPTRPTQTARQVCSRHRACVSRRTIQTPICDIKWPVRAISKLLLQEPVLSESLLCCTSVLRVQHVNVYRQAEAAGAAAASMAAEAGMTTQQQITAAAVAALTSGQIPPLVVEAWFMQKVWLAGVLCKLYFHWSFFALHGRTRTTWRTRFQALLVQRPRLSEPWNSDRRTAALVGLPGRSSRRTGCFPAG